MDGGFKIVFKFCNGSFNYTMCKFEQRFKMCKILENNPQHQLSFNSDYDILYVIKFLEFTLLVILAPTLCFMGIIINFLTSLVIKNKNMKKEFQETMYNHIIINAIFNMVYCVIVILKLINTCIFYGPSVYCSKIYRENWAQRIKII